MTPAFLTPQHLRPFSRGAERRHFANTKSNIRLTPAPSRPAASFHALAPPPTRHRGALSVTSTAPDQAPKLLDRMSDVLRTIQELLGHADLNTTMIYTHVVNKGPLGVKSPADLL